MALDIKYDELKATLKNARSSLVLWRRPLTTTVYFLKELMIEIQKLIYGLENTICISAIYLLYLECYNIGKL